MDEVSIFTFNDYVDYLNAAIDFRSQGKRGLKSDMAKEIGTQSAFVSQVLSRRSHFNLEHGERVNAFLGHTEEESHFFLLILQRTRAGTNSLKEYFDRQIREVLQRRLNMKSRFKVSEKLDPESQAIYYSSWIYGATRVLLSIDKYRTKEALQARLQIPMAKLSEVLDDLLKLDLISQADGQYVSTTRRMLLGTDSPLLARHHSNWRMQAIKSFDHLRREDAHYSSVIAVSQIDAQRIQKMCVDFVETVRDVIRDSPEEEAFVFNMDFFKL